MITGNHGAAAGASSLPMARGCRLQIGLPCALSGGCWWPAGRPQAAREGSFSSGRACVCITSVEKLGLGPAWGIPEGAQSTSKPETHLPPLSWTELARGGKRQSLHRWKSEKDSLKAHSGLGGKPWPSEDFPLLSATTMLDWGLSVRE